MQLRDIEIDEPIVSEELDEDGYLDDEKQRRPKNGKNLRKFRHPRDY